MTSYEYYSALGRDTFFFIIKTTLTFRRIAFVKETNNFTIMQHVSCLLLPFYTAKLPLATYCLCVMPYYCSICQNVSCLFCLCLMPYYCSFATCSCILLPSINGILQFLSQHVLITYCLALRSYYSSFGNMFIYH